MQVVYAKQPFPDEWTSAIFLAGPTPRSNDVQSWRPLALKLLEEMGYDGAVFVPEHEDGVFKGSYDDQVEWERKGLNFADVIIFWVPRDMETMPALTTNVEFGRWVTSGKADLGYPADAAKMRYLEWLYEHENDGYAHPHPTLRGTLNEALKRIGKGAARKGGERFVPLQIWNTDAFQRWHTQLQKNGNRLDEAEQRWVFRMPKKGLVFSWVLWVKVWIEEERRYKENEWIFARSDISCVVLYHQPGDAESMEQIQLTLVREFRSPCRNEDGYVWEVPGGSSFKEGEDPNVVAADEVKEETGLQLDASRFKYIGSRQVAATLSTHHAHVYAAELTPEEQLAVEKIAEAGKPFGVEEDTERTYVETATFGEMLKAQKLDWSMVGMIAQAIFQGQ